MWIPMRKYVSFLYTDTCRDTIHQDKAQLKYAHGLSSHVWDTFMDILCIANYKSVSSIFFSNHCNYIVIIDLD